jgi:hypothetical protein
MLFCSLKIRSLPEAEFMPTAAILFCFLGFVVALIITGDDSGVLQAETAFWLRSLAKSFLQTDKVNEDSITSTFKGSSNLSPFLIA